MIGKEAAIHLVFSVIFNQSCKSDVAFRAPGEMLKRLNIQFFDLYELERIGSQGIYQVLILKPCLHRFPQNMATYIYNSVKIINAKYKSDPRNIWRNKTESEIMNGLKSLSGVGTHKVSQLLIYLYVLGEVAEISEYHIKYISVNCANFLNNIDYNLRFIRNLQNE